MSLDDMMLRKEIAMKIIDNCKDLSEDIFVCLHCIDSAKIALDERA